MGPGFVAGLGVGDRYKVYRSWSEGLREEAISVSAFGKRLAAKGFPVKRTGVARLRKGLRLHPAKYSTGTEYTELPLAA